MTRLASPRKELPSDPSPQLQLVKRVRESDDRAGVKERRALSLQEEESDTYAVLGKLLDKLGLLVRSKLVSFRFIHFA